MMTVLLIAAATPRYSASSQVSPRPINRKNPQPSSTQPTIWESAVTVMTLPAVSIFFRSISSPIMKSSNVKPMLAMVAMESSRTQWKPWGPMANPATR